MTVIHLPHNFTPRPYQVGMWHALYEKGIKRFYLLQHRRSGKDRVALNIVIQLAMQRVGLYLYLFPQQNQVRKAIWKGISADGIPFLSQIPKALIAKTNNTDMSVEFINGSILQFAGSNNVDALVGTNPVLIAQSELALQNPYVRTYLSPILAENDGVEIILTTPRGKNHAYELYQNVKNNPLWYTTCLTVEDTCRHDGSAVITKEQIEEERRNGMADEMIRQEFYCDWNVGIQGAYYTRELDLAEKENRIGLLERARTPCWTFWDLGVSDATSVWVMQPNGPWIDLIAYYENNNFGLDHYIRWLEELRQKWNLSYRAHYAPHDIRQRQWATGARTRIELARDQGINFMVTPNISIEDGISAVRAIFQRLRFHLPFTKDGVGALREYRREYDEVRRCFDDKPFHNWASNCFVGETEILTRNGMCQIMNLPQNGQVLTVCGWKPYVNPRVTRKDAPLVEVVFSDGYLVKCTPDHMFLTVSGWKSAESLMKGTLIQSSLTQLSNIFMEHFIESDFHTHISVKVETYYTEMYGKVPLDQFLKDVISIIKMGITKITYWSILNVSIPKSICESLEEKELLPLVSIFHKELEKQQLLGMDRKREDCGTSIMQKEQKDGQNGNEKRSIVCPAMLNLMDSLEKMLIHKNIARLTARPLIIESVKKRTAPEDVWCLTVPGFQQFSLSNGSVVHNCADSLRYMAVTYRDLFTKPQTGNLQYRPPEFGLPELERFRPQSPNVTGLAGNIGK